MSCLLLLLLLGLMMAVGERFDQGFCAPMEKMAAFDEFWEINQSAAVSVLDWLAVKLRHYTATTSGKLGGSFPCRSQGSYGYDGNDLASGK